MKSAKGFGGGLDAISKDFTFTDSKYTYQSNGITGIIIVGEYLVVNPKQTFIQSDVWLIKTIAFPHASNEAQKFLKAVNNATIDMRGRIQEARQLV